jgi:hypothetical protein
VEAQILLPSGVPILKLWFMFFFFFSIFIHGFDLDFYEFGAVPSDDSLGMSSCYVKFHLDQVWERFVIWVGFLRFLGRPFFSLFVPSSGVVRPVCFRLRRGSFCR